MSLIYIFKYQCLYLYIKRRNHQMLNFASLFNQFRSQSNSGLNDLLELQSTKMGRLLDEESFLNEYKSGNSKVAQLQASQLPSMKYQKFLELIEFVTVVGPPDDKKRSYKYPLSACDLLSTDNSNTIEFFFPDRPLTVDQRIIEEVQVEVETQVQLTPEEVKPAEQKSQLEHDTAEIEHKVQVTEQKIQASQVETFQASPTKQSQSNTESTQKQNQKQKQTLPPLEHISPVETTPQKRTRKIITKQLRKVERINKKQVQPLINKLMSYFDGQVNYTLAGYVSKILTLFFNKKPADFLRFILEESVARKLLNHAQSRSVGDLIIKILTNETTIGLDKRRTFYKALLDKLSEPLQTYIMSNLSAYASQIIEKVAANLKGNNKISEFNDIFFSLDVVTQVIKNVISNQQNVSIYNAPILYTYLTSVPFVLPEDESIIDQFKKLIEHFIEKSCQKLQVTAQRRPKIGTGRVKIVQILRYIIKENILNTKEIVASKENFFPTLISLFKQYPLNNLLHNEIIKIIQVALTEPQSSTLNTAILKENLLLDFINQEAAEDNKIKSGTSVTKSRKGYIAHVINLAMKLRELAETNSAIKRLIEKPQFSNVYQNFIEKEVFNSKKSLAGFSMRKDIKHQIMFQKQDIIANYVTFLQKCPSPVFEKEPQLVNIEHPDLVQELQKQLEQNLTIKPKDVEVSSAEVTAEKENPQPDEPLSQAEVLNQAGYWTSHLEYNIDDLIIDL